MSCSPFQSAQRLHSHIGLLYITLILISFRQHIAYANIGDVDNGNCAQCQGLAYCTAMNGQLLFDPVLNYTREKTSQLDKQGVCEDLDKKTNLLTQFGDRTMFKDTLHCRTLVYNYHCLSWVASTFQHTIDNQTLSCKQGSIPLPPCRSLCVQVADTCVYSHFYRSYLENVCGNIPCVSEEQEDSTKGAIKQAPCVKGAWESNPNSTFLRCSIHAYTPPKADSHKSQGIVFGTISIIVTAVILS